MVSSLALQAVVAVLSASPAAAWVIGTQQTETHPKLTWQRCTGKGGAACTNVPGEIVIDANWRWIHSVGGYTNCYNGNTWNATACPDNASCVKNCAIEGADYSATYGITAGSNSLSLKFITKGQYSTNIGSRTYLMKDANTYEMFQLIGNEFTFDVDLSQLPCGLNGALYFVSMPAKGFGTPGAKYGTGYCDAQCARDLKYLDGTANVEGWQPSTTDKNAGTGKRGACCAEMDVWEANSVSQALTPHSCKPEKYSVCTDATCGGTYSQDRYAGSCDANGCDYNPYRVGVKDFYGKGKTVDSSKKMTVVTQFLGSGGSLTGIKRFYVQNGVVHPQPQPTIPGLPGNVITQEWCNAQKDVFQETIYPFNQWGGMASMAAGMKLGMVLVMSLWDDHYANMLWLDSTYPTDSTKLGAERGECPVTSGKPTEVEASNPNAQVIFSNIKFGPIGSTFAQPAGS